MSEIIKSPAFKYLLVSVGVIVDSPEDMLSVENIKAVLDNRLKNLKNEFEKENIKWPLDMGEMYGATKSSKTETISD